MKCKIMWTEKRCSHERNDACSLRECCLAQEIQHGFEGDIQDYAIASSDGGYCEHIIIIVNKRQEIRLRVDLCGDTDVYFHCPCDYQVVTMFEIDGKPVEGYEEEAANA